MNKTNGKNEIDYRLVLLVLNSLKEHNQISDEEYDKANKLAIKKLNPMIGGLDTHGFKTDNSN